MNRIIEELKEKREPLHEKCQQDVEVTIQKKGSHAKEKQTIHHVCSKANLGDNVCIAYAFPTAKWRLGDCPLADDLLKKHEDVEEEKVRVGQQKQKKSRR